MAVVNTLKIRMGTLSGTKTFSFKYAKSGLTSTAVKALAQALITNGSVYKYPPQVIDSATLEQVETTTFDLSD